MQKPSTTLFQDTPAQTLIACCDHYAGNIHFIKKAFALQQSLPFKFDITCDLEDGAQVGKEHSLRAEIIELINSTENSQKRAGVRVHDPTHPLFRDDIEQVVTKAGEVLSHITIPKVQGVQIAREVTKLITSVTNDAGISRPIPIHFLIETHQALREAWSIAEIPSVRSLEFGIMDFISSHHGAIASSAMQSPEQFEHPLIVRAKCEIAAAALAFGKIASHNVTIDYKNLELVRTDAKTALRQFGFQRMWSIHPDQISPICSAFAPETDEIELAGTVLQVGQEQAWGPIAVNGILYDRASYRYYWNLLRQAVYLFDNQRAKSILDSLGETVLNER